MAVIKTLARIADGAVLYQIEKTLSLADENVTRASATIADSTTDGEMVFAVDVSQVQAYIFYSDQAVTLETNSGSAADDTIALVANVPHFWQANNGFDKSLTADVTKMFVTNASGGSAEVTLLAVHDSSV